MQEIRDSKDFHIKEYTAVTFGKFDGIHRGHQELIRAILEKKTCGFKTVVFTFSIPQMAAFGKESLVLTTYAEKRTLLEKLGVDYLVEFPFTNDVKTMSPDDFIKDIIVKKLNAAYLAVGEDFHFGFNRMGNAKMLQQKGQAFGYRTDIFKKLTYRALEGKKDAISSSWIRRLLEEGNMEDVANMLGRPYSICGNVIHGRSLGHTIGFATLNIRPTSDKALPPRGVYFCKVNMQNKCLEGMANLGVRPTVEKDVSKSDLLLEIHLLQYDGEAYGEFIEADLLHFERPEKQFSGIEFLRQQLVKDKESCRCYFEKRENSGKEKVYQ